MSGTQTNEAILSAANFSGKVRGSLAVSLTTMVSPARARRMNSGSRKSARRCVPTTPGTSCGCQSWVIRTSSATSSISTKAHNESPRWLPIFSPTLAIISSTSVRPTRSRLTEARNSRLSSAFLRSVTSRETTSSRTGWPSASRMGETLTSHHFGSSRRVRKKPMKFPSPPAMAAAMAVRAFCRSSPSQKASHGLFK